MPFSEVKFPDLPSQMPLTLSTPRGNAVLEIQGELVIPDAKPDGLSEQDQQKFTKIDSTVFLSQEEIDAVRFGTMELEGKKATLFIGSSQRLIGDLKEMSPPLALLKMSEDGGIEIVDVIKYKVVFTGRPLPIM